MAREGHDLSEEVRRTVVEAMAEASIEGDAVDLHRGSYDKTDEAAMLAVVERTTEAGALAGLVTESAAAGHARVLAACLAKGAPPDGNADIEAIRREFRAQPEFRGMGGAKPTTRVGVSVPRVPLTLAIGCGGANSLECARLLLDAGCDPDAGSVGYASPLFFVPKCGLGRDEKIALVRLLVEAGCNVNVKALDGATALFDLTKAGLHEVLEAVIIERGADTELGPGPPSGSYMTPPLAFACAWSDMPPHIAARYPSALADRIATVRALICLGSKLIPRGVPSRTHRMTPEAMLRRWATAAGPPHKADALRTAVADLKIKDMRAIITRAGLSHGDCVEKSDLRARTREALEKTAPANELLRLADLVDHLIEGGGDDAETREARQVVRAPLIEAFEEARPALY